MTQVQIPVGRRPQAVHAAAPLPDEDAFTNALASVERDGNAEHRDRRAGKIRILSRNQKFTRSCAATVLSCAGEQMGVTPRAKKNSRHAKHIQAALYKSMRELTDDPSVRDPTPIAIALAAAEMGMTSTISLSKTSDPGKDGPVHEVLVKNGRLSGIPILAQEMPQPLDNRSRTILLVYPSKNGVERLESHALLGRADGSVMDPADGSNHQSLAHLNKALARSGRHYRQQGVTINLMRQG
jgi:hypothetical protein